MFIHKNCTWWSSCPKSNFKWEENLQSYFRFVFKGLVWNLICEVWCKFPVGKLQRRYRRSCHCMESWSRCVCGKRETNFDKNFKPRSRVMSAKLTILLHKNLFVTILRNLFYRDVTASYGFWIKSKQGKLDTLTQTCLRKFVGYMYG